MGRRILWLGDGGCHTGFARVTHAIGERLIRDYGHDVSVLATNYQGDYYPTELKLYRPNTIVGTDYYGLSRILEMLARVEPDVVVMLGDPQIIIQWLFENPKYDPDRLLLGYRPLLAYVPIDGHEYPKAWDVLGRVTQRVAMSKHGQTVMPEAPLVYHGIDSDVFYPVTERPITVSTGETLYTKRDCKRVFGYDQDGFLVLRVDSNSGRKDYPASWKALVPVMTRHSDISVHFHCKSTFGADASGVDFPALLSRDPETKDRFHFPDLHTSFIGWPVENLCALYNAADLFLSTSRGEGFGLTIAEALACGTPVIAQHVASIPEVVGPGGILITPERRITVPFGWEEWLPNIAEFSAAIEHLYLAGGVRRKLGEAGLAHVRETFSWDVATAQMDGIIEKLAREPEAAHAVPEHE
jgi:glycosyltransferase involved in cell wall biosynthesis